MLSPKPSHPSAYLYPADSLSRRSTDLSRFCREKAQEDSGHLREVEDSCSLTILSVPPVCDPAWLKLPLRRLFSVKAEMRIACLQFAPNVGDVENNINHAETILDKADPKNLDWLVLPEMAFSGEFSMRTIAILPTERCSFYLLRWFCLND